MPKRGKSFYLIIKDHDRKLFNCIGPISSDREYNKRVCEARDNGRDVLAATAWTEVDKKNAISHWEHEGYKYVDELLVDAPVDHSKEYNKRLPEYAKDANRNRIVERFCDTCGCNRLAEMTTDYPGENVLSSSEILQYEAKCLKCGSIARDGYNWWR